MYLHFLTALNYLMWKGKYLDIIILRVTIKLGLLVCALLGKNCPFVDGGVGWGWVKIKFDLICFPSLSTSVFAHVQ